MIPAPARTWFWLLLTSLIVLTCGRTSAAPAPEDAPIVIMIGIDALQPAQLARTKPPHLTRLASDGVRAERMAPSYPTLTFPNFYTLATGLRPQRHGIIGNHMFDPEFNASFSLGSKTASESRWWGGEPLWVTAQKQGLRAACMFWPGSEAEIAGVRPWAWRPYDGTVTPEARVQQVLEWLALPAAERPRLITLYFSEVDTAGHRNGPRSPEADKAIEKVDAMLGVLLEGIEKLGLTSKTNLVIVSDHGMAETSPDRTVSLSDLIDVRTVHIDFSGPIAGLRPNGITVDELHATLKAKASHFQVYRREELPKRWHFRDHRRIPPIILTADEGWVILKRPLLDDEARQKFLRGNHGFDPALPSMSATFIGYGPAFQRAKTLPEVDNVQIYPLVCTLLGLTPAPNDGDNKLAKAALLPAAVKR